MYVRHDVSIPESSGKSVPAHIQFVLDLEVHVCLTSCLESAARTQSPRAWRRILSGRKDCGLSVQTVLRG